VKSRANQSPRTSRDTTLRSSSTWLQGTGFEPQKRSVCLPGASDGGHARTVAPVSPRRPRAHARTDAQARGHAIIILVSPRPVAHGRCRPGAPCRGSHAVDRARPASPSRFPGIPGTATYARARHPGPCLFLYSSQASNERASHGARARSLWSGASVPCRAARAGRVSS